jgi:hypothetical protein
MMRSWKYCQHISKMPTLTYNGVSSNVIKKADSILNLLHHIIIFRDTNGVICIVLVLRLSLVEQELHTLPEHRSSVPDLSGVRVTRTSVLCVMFCRSLFVLLSFFLWPLCCLSLWILITLLVSSNSSSTKDGLNRHFNVR